MSFDKDRPLTPFSHLIEDDKDGGAASRRQHFVEWATYVNKLTDPNDIERNAEANMRRDYSIHFHVWNKSTWRDFLRDAKAHTGDYKTLYFGRNDTEVIAVLERT